MLAFIHGLPLYPTYTAAIQFHIHFYFPHWVDGNLGVGTAPGIPKIQIRYRDDLG
jgi:hypothetical protein